MKKANSDEDNISARANKVYTLLVGGSAAGFAGGNSRYWLFVGLYTIKLMDRLATREWLLQDSRVLFDPSH